MTNKLAPEEITLLKKRHKTEKSRDVSDRIKAIILHDRGWNEEEIAEALLVHSDTVKRHLKDYHAAQKKLKSTNSGSEAKLNDQQTTELLTHLKEHTYTKSQDICQHVKSKYQVIYTIAGITSWLKTHGFSYKKPKIIPLKADPEKQKFFIEYYEKLKNTISEDRRSQFYSEMRFIQLWQQKYHTVGLKQEVISL